MFFGKYFSILDEGKVVVKFVDGNEIYSCLCLGEKVDFEEVLEVLVGVYLNKDVILKLLGILGLGVGIGIGGGNVLKFFIECKIDVEKIVYM